MAQVTMDIAELDKLRGSISEKEYEIKELNKTLNDVKADKRVVIKKVPQPISRHNACFRFDHHRMIGIISRYINGPREFRFSSSHSLESELSNCIEIVPGYNLPESAEYVNFEDVKAELAEKLEKDYSNELGELRHTKNTLNEKIAQVIAENRDEIASLKKEHDEDIKLYQERVSELAEDYRKLLEGKEEIKELDRVKELLIESQIQLHKLKNRGFFQRLLNL